MEPKDFVLCTFNAFSPGVADYPDTVLKSITNYLAQPLTADQILEAAGTNQYSGQSITSVSAEDVFASFAASMGISGSCGFFSGSVQASLATKKVQSRKDFNFCFSGRIDFGSTKIRDNVDILSYFKDEFRKSLNGIVTLEDAANFAETYGTHVILGVNLGGNFFVNVSAIATSESDELTMSSEITASYDSGISSLDLLAEAMVQTKSAFSNQSIVQPITASGGDPTLAAALDPAKQSTFDDWNKSCSVNTVSGISAVLEIYKLATDKRASAQLKTYMDLRVLKQSLNHPSVYWNSVVPQPGQPSRVEVNVPDGYKIIGGGAAVNHGSTNFLTGSYPAVSEDGVIAGWVAESHDIDKASVSTDTLTAYAMAVYDPSDLMRVEVRTATGTNPGIGADSASAEVGYQLSGGGLSVQVDSGNYKFITGCYPSSSNTWTGSVHDFQYGAAGANLTVYAIGIDLPLNSAELALTATQLSTGPQTLDSGKTSASLSGINVCTGGLNIADATGAGNLLQQTYATGAGEWSGYQKGVDKFPSSARVNAHALGIKAAFVDVQTGQWDDLR